jgi:ParB family transcriptional regulator, chromosome partitioning protein
MSPPGRLKELPMSQSVLSHPEPIALIPLNKLVASPRNVRRKNRKADIDALAASIASRGLLQNLCVTPTEDGRFEVEAGERRRLALKKLAQSGVIARDFPVPCHVGAKEEGREVSLTENVHRIDMDAMDEVEAYAILVEEGSSAEDVARRFGVTRRHVDQRLALAGLSPKIKAAWKRGDVNLDAARAFCLVGDHARQEAVFKSMSKPVTHAGSVRARLMEGRMRASDRLAKFVGLEAYEAAGGAVVRDLFDDEAVFIEDPSLMTRLAEEKLETRREAFLAEGWGWMEVNLGHGPYVGSSGARLEPEWRPLTEAEDSELTRLREDMRVLDDALGQDSTEDDARWSERDDLAARIETLRQSQRRYDPELMRHAGVVLSIDYEGRVQTALGVIRKSDEKLIRAIRRKRETATTEAHARSAGDAAIGDDSTCTSDAERSLPALPKAVVRELSQARTRALRLALAQDVDAALAVAIAAMSARAVHRASLPGIEVAAHLVPVADLGPLEAARGALAASVPADEAALLGWSLLQPRERLLSILAILVAGAVDLTHETGGPSDSRRQDLADQLSARLRLDMRAYWAADADYWSRLPKATLLQTLADAPAVAELSSDARQAMLRAHAKLKKEELATKVGAALEGTGYLPDLLLTSFQAGEVELTPAGPEIIAAE